MVSPSGYFKKISDTAGKCFAAGVKRGLEAAKNLAEEVDAAVYSMRDFYTDDFINACVYGNWKEKKEMIHDPNALANILVYFNGNYYSADNVKITDGAFNDTKFDVTCYISSRNRRNPPEVKTAVNGTVSPFKIRKVLINGPATIVFWADGTKTVVKCSDENFDLEKAIAMAFTRKALGNKHDYYNVIEKWTKKAKNFTEEPTIDPAMAAVMSTFLGGH